MSPLLVPLPSSPLVVFRTPTPANGTGALLLEVLSMKTNSVVTIYRSELWPASLTPPDYRLHDTLMGLLSSFVLREGYKRVAQFKALSTGCFPLNLRLHWREGRLLQTGRPFH